MAELATSGRYPKSDKRHPGWHWEIYPDPTGSQGTGWTLKIWDPKDTSNGGKPQEFFEPYDYQGDLDEANQREQAANSRRTARSAADEADRRSLAARQDAADRQHATELDRMYGDKQADRTSREREGAADRRARLREIEVRLKEDKRQFDLTHGLDEQRLGADLLKTAASLRGPDDLVQGWAYAQGVNDAGLSPYVRAIQNGTATAYGGGQARNGNPAPVTVNSLARSMTGGSYGTDAYGRPRLAPDKQAFVDSVGQSVASGLANKPLGFFENMTDGQRKAFFSAASYNGADSEAEYEYYKRSRPGQRSPLAG